MWTKLPVMVHLIASNYRSHLPFFSVLSPLVVTTVESVFETLLNWGKVWSVTAARTRSQDGRREETVCLLCLSCQIAVLVMSVFHLLYMAAVIMCFPASALTSVRSSWSSQLMMTNSSRFNWSLDVWGACWCLCCPHLRKETFLGILFSPSLQVHLCPVRKTCTHYWSRTQLEISANRSGFI